MKIDIQLEKLYEIIIEKLYKEAWTLQQVVKWLKKEYDLKQSRAYEVTRLAKEYFGEYLVDKDDDLLTECIEILKANRQKAAKQNNLKEVRESTKEIAKLMQLYVKKLDISGSINIEQPLFGPNIDKEDED